MVRGRPSAKRDGLDKLFQKTRYVNIDSLSDSSFRWLVVKALRSIPQVVDRPTLSKTPVDRGRSRSHQNEVATALHASLVINSFDNCQYWYRQDRVAKRKRLRSRCYGSCDTVTS